MTNETSKIKKVKTGVRNTTTAVVAFAKLIVMSPIMIASAPAETLFYGWRRDIITTALSIGSLICVSILTGLIVDVDPANAVGYLTAIMLGSVATHQVFSTRDRVTAIWNDLQTAASVERVDVEPAAREIDDTENVSMTNNPNVGGVDAQSINTDSESESNTDTNTTDDKMDEVEHITEPPELDFDDVAGMGDLKQKLKTRVIEPVENPEKYEEYGLTVANGFLFHGPPGTGKTYLSKALAGELGVHYANVKGTDIISKWVGEGAENVSTLFEEAREHEPCMLFIDELDAIASERRESGQHQMQTQVVNQLLEEISEINEKDLDIIVVAATNRKDIIDDAILRSGRLGEKIEIGMPDAQSRIAILDEQLDAPRSDTLDLGRFKRDTEGLSAADMEQVSTNAARKAMVEDVDVGNKHVRYGIEETTNTD